MAYWFPELMLGFQCPIPPESQTNHIFYYEALAITCAILDECHDLARIVVYSNNQNTVDIWHSLKATAPYNHLLILAIDRLISARSEVRVVHVPGIHNTVADALSRFNNEHALQLAPGLQVTTFQPPQGTLGAAKK